MDKELKEELEYFEEVIEKYEKLQYSCWLCGSSKEITEHHIEPFNKRSPGKDGKGKIIVCRDCHNKIESIKSALEVCFGSKKLSITEFKKVIKTFRR